MIYLLKMENDGHTANGFRTWSTDCGKSGDDVGMLLPYQIHHRTAHGADEPEVSGINRYKHQIDRSAETDATGFEGSGIKCCNLGELYH